MNKVQKIREEVVRLFNHVKDSKFESDSGAFYYLKDLLDFIDSLQEEPISDDLGKAAKGFSNNLDNIHGSIGEQTRNAFMAGAKWQKTKDESYSNDLGDYINELSKQFQDVSFAKLSRIAVRAAKWKEKQDQKTIELAEDHAKLVEMEKAENLKKLADAMYYAAQTMTTDASRLWKAMD